METMHMVLLMEQDNECNHSIINKQVNFGVDSGSLFEHCDEPNIVSYDRKAANINTDGFISCKNKHECVNDSINIMRDDGSDINDGISNDMHVSINDTQKHDNLSGIATDKEKINKTKGGKKHERWMSIIIILTDSLNLKKRMVLMQIVITSKHEEKKIIINCFIKNITSIKKCIWE